MKTAELIACAAVALTLLPQPCAAQAEQAIALLRASDGSTDDHQIAAALDVVRRDGPHASRGARAAVYQLLPHHARVYRERDKILVLRLRAYAFATLSDIGVPDAALPMLLDAVAHLDERMTAIEVGAAVRAVGSLGRRGAAFAPYLVEALHERFAESEFSLERYAPEYPDAEATTVQLEAVRALGRIGGARDALERLRKNSELDERVYAAIDDAIQIDRSEP
jgi:hypothetical protein